MSETGYDSRPDTEAHIARVRSLLGTVIADLRERSRVHDASKLEEPEKSAFDEFTPRLRASTYGSEEYERFRREMGAALAHHYAHNRHHPEHFADSVMGMNLLDLVEMVCDWVAAASRHNDGCPYKSVEINQRRFGYSDELKCIFLNTLPLLTKESSDSRESPSAKHQKL